MKRKFDHVQRNFNAGEIIYKIGDRSEALYLIHSGTVSIRTRHGLEVGILNDGEIFGEVGRVIGSPRTVTAKAIAAARDIPYFAVNHLEGHALSGRLTDEVSFPYLLLLVSGGHTQLLAVHGPGQYERYGTTMDDAAGEAFDKGAKLLGIPYPGGAELERRAREGDACAFPFACARSSQRAAPIAPCTISSHSSSVICFSASTPLVSSP